ncbi:MAG: tetratricopeptide repeat protein [Bacteroidota bacterium]|nr:tetratricopeptide repeat protein [Bacteroidota bacterium]
MAFRSKIVFAFVFLVLQNTFFSQNKKLDSLKKVVATTKTDSTLLKNLIELSRLCSKQGFPNEGLEYGKRALAICNQKNDLEKASIANMQIGSNYLALNNTDSSRIYYTNALLISRKLGDTLNVSNIYNNLGLIKYYQSDFPGALNYYLISLKIKEEMKDSAKLGWNYNAIGALYTGTASYDKALIYLTKAMTIAKIRNNQRGYTEASGNIANIYKAKKEYNKALSVYKEILSITLKNNEGVFLDETYSNIANTYFLQNKYDISIRYYLTAIDVAVKKSNQRVKGFCHIGLARNYRSTNRYKEAISNCHAALAISEELKLKQIAKEAYEELYKSYKKSNVDSSLFYYEKYNEILATIISEGSHAEMLKLEERYENEKKIAITEINHTKEIEIEKVKSKNQRTISYFFVLVAILVGVFLFVIYKRLQLTRKQKEIINIQKQETEEQKSIIEEKQKEIVDSINYAKRIQYTLLAHEDILKENLKEHFVLFKPKDIVSGDFYWATKKDNRFYLAVCDCTGHGVPGAFMSLLNISFLNEAINEKNISEPHEVFNHVRKRLIENISQNGGQDGMDGILVCIDTLKNTITYSAANNSPILISANEAVELPKDKMPVGKGERENSFTLQHIDIKNGDILYLYTDGFADQFGGPKGKKYKYKQLNSRLLAINQLPLKDQSSTLLSNFKDWKGNLEQVDDVCVIGIKF